MPPHLLHHIQDMQKKCFCFAETPKVLFFVCGVQAVQCLVVESILLETLAFCSSSNTNRNSLSRVENKLLHSPQKAPPLKVDNIFSFRSIFSRLPSFFSSILTLFFLRGVLLSVTFFRLFHCFCSIGAIVYSFVSLTRESAYLFASMLVCP